MTTNFFGSPPTADNNTILRQYHFGASSGSSYWAEQMVAAGVTTSTSTPVVPLALTTLGELKTVSSAGAASTQVSVRNVAGTTLGVQFADLTTLSKIRVETTAAQLIAGNATVHQGTTPWVIAGDSSALVFQGTSPWVIGGNTTAIISTASKVQVEPGAGAVFPISGNSTVLQGTSPWVVAGTATVAPAAGSTWNVAGNATVTPAAGTTFNVAGNTTVSPAAGTTFNVAGNTTVSPAAGTTFNVAGNTTVSPAGLTTWRTQNRLDDPVNRIQVFLHAQAAAPTSNEQLFNLDRTTNFTTGAVGTNYLIAATRTLRVQQVNCAVTITTNIVQGCYISLRASSVSGVAATTVSPIVWKAFLAPISTSVNSAFAAAFPIPEGLDLAGGSSGRNLALSLITGATAVGTGGTSNVRVTATVTGYEHVS